MYNEKFLQRMAERALRDRSVFIFSHKRQVIVTSVKTGKRAIAKCHKDDKWDYAIGIGIAYCRLKDIPIKKNKINENLSIYRVGKNDLYFLYIGNNLYFKVKPRENGFFEVIPYEKVVEIPKTHFLYSSLRRVCSEHSKLKFNYCPPRENLQFIGTQTLRSSAFNVTFKYPHSIVILDKETNRTYSFTPLDNLNEIENVGYGYSLFKGYHYFISMSNPIFIYEDEYYKWYYDDKWYYDEESKEIISIRK